MGEYTASVVKDLVIVHHILTSHIKLQRSVKTPPRTLTNAPTPSPTQACLLPSNCDTAALLLLFPLEPPVEPLPLEPPAVVAGALGMKVAEGFAKHELATALAWDTEEGA